MKKILYPIAFFIFLISSLAWSEMPDTIIAAGLQPQLSMDKSGIIRMVFGRADSIFCSTSNDKGSSFSNPVFVGYIKGMHLGMSRGPQIASSVKSSIITAMDKAGNIHFFQLMHVNNSWKYRGLINDIPSSAPEGLMSIAADAKDNFYAVWLDTRHDKKNNICFSSLTANTEKWKKNALVYISPDEHVCECCKPSIDVKDSKVAIMYRNWLAGSRDLYVITSDNGGKTFKEAQKLGSGTWKLKGCPMDGGGIRLDNDGTIETVWQREGNVYYCKPNESEIKVSKGRTCSIAMDKSKSKKPIITFEDGGMVKLMDLNAKTEMNVGKGSFLKSMVFNDSVLCIWEQDKNIMFRKISMPAATIALLK